MAICKNCGVQIEEGERFCPNCGQAVEAAPAAVSGSSDVNENRFFGILAYLGPLVFVPMFARKNSDFAQYHARQGFNVFVLYAASWVIDIILGIINGAVGGTVILPLINWLISVAPMVFSVFGIINAASGKKKELPLIGGLDLWGKFTGK